MDLQSRNLVIPRGSILFNPFIPGTFTGTGFEQLGNCPEFTLSRDVQKLPHRSSQQEYRLLDAEINIGGDYTGSIVTDDVKAANMRLWFMGTQVIITTASVASTVEIIPSVTKGRLYQLGASTLAPTGLRNLTLTTLTDGAGVPVVYVAGVDYEFDGPNGLLTILTTGSIVDASAVTATFATAASTRTQLTSGTDEREGELLFVSNNPFGANHRDWFPRAKIGPNGDLNLMTDSDSPTWQQVPLSMTALKHPNHSKLHYRDIVTA